jgi:PAS domain S-box-containing protein
MKFTIRLKLIAFAFLSALLVGGGIYSYSAYQGRQRILHSFKARCEGVANHLARDASDSLYFLDVGSLKSLLSNARHNPDVLQAYVLDSDGLVLTDGTDENPEGFQELKDPWFAGSLKTTNLDVDVGPDFLKVSTPVLMPDGTKVGYLQLSFSLEDANRFIRDSRIAGLYLSLVCLAIGGGVAFILAGSISRPINLIAAASSRIGEGDFGARLEIRRSDELGQLATSINLMADRLSVSTVSRDFAESVFNSMADCLIVMDASETIQTVNSAANLLLGYDEGVLVGTKWDTIADKTAADLAKRKGTKHGSKDPVLRTETTMISRDGKRVPVFLTLSPLLRAGGDISGYVCVAQNLTHRREAESRLEASRKRFEILCETAPIGIFQTDTSGRNLYSNALCQEIVGLSMEEALGEGWARNVHPDDSENVRKNGLVRLRPVRSLLLSFAS